MFFPSLTLTSLQNFTTEAKKYKKWHKLVHIPNHYHKLPCVGIALVQGQFGVWKKVWFPHSFLLHECVLLVQDGIQTMNEMIGVPDRYLRE